MNMPTIPYVPFWNKEFPTKSGKIEFYVEMLVPYGQEVCAYKEPIEASPSNPLAKKYPLTFLSTHTKFRTHSQYCNLAWLNEMTANGEGFLEINPKDAQARGIAEGEVVRVFNDRGEMKVLAKLTQADQAGRGQLLPGRLGHAGRQAVRRGPPQQPDPSARQPGAVADPQLPVQRRLLRLPRAGGRGVTAMSAHVMSRLREQGGEQ